jgi:hypothetical protein
MYWSKWYHCTKAGSAPVNGDTVKTSAAVFNIPICKVEHIKMQSSFWQVELKLLLRPKETDTIYL